MSRIVRGNSEALKEMRVSKAPVREAKAFERPSFNVMRSADSVGVSEAEEMVKNAVTRAQAEAFKEAEAKLKAPLNAALENLEGVLDEVSVYRRELFKEVESEVLDLVRRVCKKILNAELRTDPENIKSVIEKGLEHLDKERSIELLLSPKDFEIFKASKPDAMQKLVDANRLDIATDFGLEPGQALLKTKTRELEIGFDAMVDQIVNTFVESNQETKETGDDGDKV